AGPLAFSSAPDECAAKIASDTRPKPDPRRTETLDLLFEILGCAEGHLLARLDLDRLARRRVAAHARRTLANLQDAETANANAITLLEVLRDHRHHVLEHGVGLLLRKIMRFRKSRTEMAQRDGIHGCCRLCCRSGFCRGGFCCSGGLCRCGG